MSLERIPAGFQLRRIVTDSRGFNGHEVKVDPRDVVRPSTSPNHTGEEFLPDTMNSTGLVPIKPSILLADLCRSYEGRPQRRLPDGGYVPPKS